MASVAWGVDREWVARFPVTADATAGLDSRTRRSVKRHVTLRREACQGACKSRCGERIGPGGAETAPVRNTALHRQLETFTVDASGRLSAEAAGGAEIPFEVAEERGGGRAAGRALYVYRPLTAEFIASRRQTLATLPSYGEAIQGLTGCEALDSYLIERGEVRLPEDRRGLADGVLEAFLGAVFAERSEFGFEPAHFEAAYGELERALYDGHCIATVVAPVLGIALDPDTTELELGEGVSLIRGDALGDAPPQAVWGDSDEPNVLALLAIDQERADRPPVSVARARFRRILSALRLFERGGYALGPAAYARSEGGSWRPVPIGVSGRPRLLTLIPAAQQEELRAFYRLVSRRSPAGGELSWALARFEMGCERVAPFEALTDYLLALRALLEPEGPASGRMAQRLAVICGAPEERAALAQRVARAIAMEGAVITGMASGERAASKLVDELAEHLRAILRDALCGHLDSDLCAVADGLLAEAAETPAR
jgi:hypothetical protein